MSRERDMPEQKPESHAGPSRVAADEAGMRPAGTASWSAEASRSNPGRALIDDVSADELRSRWREVQQRFVDDPRRAMSEATELVSSAAKRVDTVIAGRLDELRRNWPSDSTRDSEAETEQLRGLMQRYRDLLDRLLAA